MTPFSSETDADRDLAAGWFAELRDRLCREFEAIEQNREKPSRWGKLAREKHQVVQFRDVVTHKYVAVSVDGEITEYGR